MTGNTCLKFAVICVIASTTTGCEFFSALFRGIGAVGNAPKVAFLEDSDERIFERVATPGATIRVAAINDANRGAILRTYDNFNIEGYIDYIVQSPNDDYLFVQHVNTFPESGFVAEEYGPRIFNNISGRREYFATDNTEATNIARLCIPGSSLLADGRDQYDLEMHGPGEPTVLVDDHISNVYRGLGWLDENRMLMLADLELQLRIESPTGEIYDVFRNPDRRGVFFLVLVRNDRGTWNLMSCGEDEITLPTFPQSRSITLSAGRVLIDGAPLLNPSGNPITTQPVDSISGPFRL